MSSRSTRRTPWRFELWDILTRSYLGNLPLGDVEWNRPLNGAGKLSGRLRPGVRLDGDSRAEWDALIRFERAWLFCRYGRVIPWAGQLVSGPWSTREASMTIGATESAAWLDEVHLGVTRTRMAWDAVEQFRIVREALAVVGARPGAVRITPDAAVSGVAASAEVEGQAFKPLGEFIGELAERDRGFDWAVGARESPQDGRPELHLVLRYPEWDQGRAPTVELVSTPAVSTVLGHPDLPRDATDRRTVVYATGEGQSPDQAVAVDVDPLVEAGRAVRREKVTSHSGIADVGVLAEHAHTERLALSRTTGTLQLEVPAADPDFTTYDTGSRVRLRLRDEFSDTVFPAVRIIERTMRCARTDAPDMLTLTLDLADAELPDGVLL